MTVSKDLILNLSKYLAQEREQLKSWVYISRSTSKHLVNYCRQSCRKTNRFCPLTGQTTACVCSSRLSAESTGLARELAHDHREWLSSACPLGPASKSDSLLEKTGLACGIWHISAQCAVALGLCAPALAVGMASMRRDWDAPCVTHAFPVGFSRSITGHALAPPVRNGVPQEKFKKEQNSTYQWEGGGEGGGSERNWNWEKLRETILWTPR